MRDNRDPAALGTRLLNARASAPDVPLSALAEMIDGGALYAHALEQNVPMCGLPPEGRRALVNGKPGSKIDPAGLRIET